VSLRLGGVLETGAGRDPRSDFVFSPAPGAVWRAGLEFFGDALTHTFPGAFLEPASSSLRGDPVLDFEVEVCGDGVHAGARPRVRHLGGRDGW